MPENTTNRPLEVHLMGAMSDGREGYILGMEADGGRQLLASQDLPTAGSDNPQLLEWGFTFGEPHPHDPLFRPATLPPGWRREAGDGDPRGSYLVDEHGRRRVSIFYKAAFYDRKADMYVISLHSYLEDVLAGRAELLHDDVWATRETVAAALGDIRDKHTTAAGRSQQLVDTGRDPDGYWAAAAAKDREIAGQAAALMAKLSE